MTTAPSPAASLRLTTRKRLARLWASPLPEAAVVALAALLRCWRLGYHSVWFDEAVSLDWAGHSAGYIWRTTIDLVQDKHPPVYYLFLHAWKTLLEPLGLAQNDAALRLSGALLGVLAVWGLLLLARRLSGRRVALTAGLLAALSPALVWYSQELRMFQPAAAALVWGAFALVRAWQGATMRRRLGWWALLVACFAAALYSYLFSALAMPAAGLSLLLLWLHEYPAARRHSTRRLLEGLLAFAVVALLFAPLARTAWLVNSSEGQPGAPFADFAATSLRLLRLASAWRPGWPQPLVDAVALLTALLALLGLLLPGRTRSWLDRAWLLLWIGLPLLVGNLLLATSDSVFAEDRYFLFVVPFILWAAARGLVCLSRRSAPAGWLAGGTLLLALALALPPLWTPARARENWRAAAALIAEQTLAAPGLPAAALAHVDYTHIPLAWYLRKEPALDTLPLFFPFGGSLRAEQVDAVVAPPLMGIEQAGYATLWLTQSHLEGVDDDRLVQRWLAARYPLITQVYPAGIELSGYAVQSRFDTLPPGVTANPVELAPGLALAACELTPPTVRASDDALHPPSGWAHVRLWWQATGPIEQDHQVRVRAADAVGVWGESLPRERSTLRLFPTSTWHAGEFVRDEHDVNLNPVAPPGDYAISVRLLDAAGAEAGPETPCATLTVRR